MKKMVVLILVISFICLFYAFLFFDYRDPKIEDVKVKKMEKFNHEVDSIDKVIVGVNLIRTAISDEFSNAVDSFVVHPRDPYFAKRAEEAEITNRVNHIFCKKIKLKLLESKLELLKKMKLLASARE